jgi:cell division septum initiation protein DivIVA
MVANELEALQNEYQSAFHRVEELENTLRKYDEMERFMKEALVDAKKTGEMAKINAEKESTLIIREAETRAQEILSNTKQQLSKLEGDVELLRSQKDTYLVRFKSLMRSQLELINLLSASDEKPARETPGPVPPSTAPTAEYPAFAAKMKTQNPGPEDASGGEKTDR